MSGNAVESLSFGVHGGNPRLNTPRFKALATGAGNLTPRPTPQFFAEERTFSTKKVPPGVTFRRYSYITKMLTVPICKSSQTIHAIYLLDYVTVSISLLIIIVVHRPPSRVQ